MLTLLLAFALQTPAETPPRWNAVCLNEIVLSATHGATPLDILDDAAVAAARARATSLWSEATNWMARHESQRVLNDRTVLRMWSREQAGEVPEGAALLLIEQQEAELDYEFTSQVAAYQDFPSCNFPAPVNVMQSQRVAERRLLLR